MSERKAALILGFCAACLVFGLRWVFMATVIITEETWYGVVEFRHMTGL